MKDLTAVKIAIRLLIEDLKRHIVTLETMLKVLEDQSVHGVTIKE